VYFQQNVIRTINLRRIRWIGLIACMEGKRVLVGNPKEMRLLGTLDVGERIILKWILEKQDGVVSIRLIWLKTGTSRGLM
jgi:hypothetical protein